MQHDTSTVVESTVDFGSDCYRPRLDQRFADRILSRRQCLTVSGLHADARIGDRPFEFYFLQIDRWYLERRIYLAVGINISVASALVLAHSAWWTLFTTFVGGAMVWFAATGYCIMANALYWLGAEPRLNPNLMPSARCSQCAMADVCVSNPKLRPA